MSVTEPHVENKSRGCRRQKGHTDFSAKVFHTTTSQPYVPFVSLRSLGTQRWSKLIAKASPLNRAESSSSPCPYCNVNSSTALCSRTVPGHTNRLVPHTRLHGCRRHPRVLHYRVRIRFQSPLLLWFQKPMVFSHKRHHSASQPTKSSVTLFLHSLYLNSITFVLIVHCFPSYHRFLEELTVKKPMTALRQVYSKRLHSIVRPNGIHSTQDTFKRIRSEPVLNSRSVFLYATCPHYPQSLQLLQLATTDIRVPTHHSQHPEEVRTP